VSEATVSSENSMPPGWRRIKLAQICELNPRRPPIEREAEALTTFIPMSAMSENGGGITATAKRPFREVKKGYTYFADGDVLFAKITPCMENGKHTIARNLVDGFGFGSTEFHVLRPGRSVVSEWIHFCLIQGWPPDSRAAINHQASRAVSNGGILSNRRGLRR